MKFLFNVVFIICSPFLMAQIRLSEHAEISIITCGPSQDELYTAFGHSAIHVYDSLNGINHAFNYGMFSFDQPHFYLNFARGSSFYVLGIEYFPDFKSTYEYYNRSIYEQKLNLTTEQKQRVFNFLQWNALKENRSYRYDYFYDNCATRVRDAFNTALDGEVKFDSSYIKTDYTIRNLTDLYLGQQPWGDLGIDICLGLPMDKKASPYEYMFLPDYIQSSFDHASINGVPIVSQKITLYEAKPEKVEGLPHPLIVFGILVLVTLAISVFDWRRKKLSKWFDLLLFTGLGLIGIVLLLLWTATDHKAAANNMNLLWALPTNLLIFGILKKSPPAWISKYFFFVFALSAMLLVIWRFLPQQLNVFLIPVVVVIMMRAYMVNKLTIT